MLIWIAKLGVKSKLKEVRNAEHQWIYRSPLILNWVQRLDQFLMLFSDVFQWVLVQTVNHGLQNTINHLRCKLVSALIVLKSKIAFSKETRDLNARVSRDELFGNFSLSFKLDIWVYFPLPNSCMVFFYINCLQKDTMNLFCRDNLG